MKLTQEQIKKVMNCKTKEELLDLAKAEGVALTAEEAESFFTSISERKIDLEELESVSGGDCVGNVCGVDC